MRALRSALAFSLTLFLCLYTLPLHAGGKPLGILMLAYNTQLNASEAFAGLSVFPGERMATDADGKAMVRIGASAVTLSEQSSATLEASGDGAHVDLLSGSVFLSSTQKNPLEAHVEDALLRPHGEEKMQARVLKYAPKVLQITTRVGSLDFSYHGEFRVLPEGQTYRIYLESEAEPQGPAGAGAGTAQTAGMSAAMKVTYFILAGAGAGLAAWGINDLIQSNSGVQSPAKP